ncbi:tetratricopeptide repeat protein [Neogemmobacter tilapiae]|uniref:tetratricopeptide repeat protein n=1 Tax=Neogemmobacter tilapiae TaxID=875041 RepID=UPI0016783F2C|nr:tetratricopeptide repeat protein [Gemmobacter tilapiae]
MKARARFHNHLFAGVLALILSGPVLADPVRLDDLFDQLKTADAEQAEKLERDILLEWSKTGSPAFDLLLERGGEAMAAGDFPTAIEHLTALIDHDPEFAEGYNARATAYYMAGEIGPSIADIRKTLSLNPRHFGAMMGFAMILEELEKPDEALEVYKAALAIHPHLSGVSEAIERLETAKSGQGI